MSTSNTLASRSQYFGFTELPKDRVFNCAAFNFSEMLIRPKCETMYLSTFILTGRSVGLYYYLFPELLDYIDSFETLETKFNKDLFNG